MNINCLMPIYILYQYYNIDIRPVRATGKQGRYGRRLKKKVFVFGTQHTKNYILAIVINFNE